jgi:hypothetical protein
VILIVLLLLVLGGLSVVLGVAHLVGPVHTNRVVEVVLSVLSILVGTASIYIASIIAYTF